MVSPISARMSKTWVRVGVWAEREKARSNAEKSEIRLVFMILIWGQSCLKYINRDFSI